MNFPHMIEESQDKIVKPGDVKVELLKPHPQTGNLIGRVYSWCPSRKWFVIHVDEFVSVEAAQAYVRKANYTISISHVAPSPITLTESWAIQKLCQEILNGE